MARGVNRIIAIASLLVIVVLISPAQAVDYSSSWELVESGTEEDLMTAEAYGEYGIWAFGTNGAMVRSDDNGSTWELIDSPVSSDLQYSDSAHGALAVASADGLVLIKQEIGEDWSNISLEDDDVQFNGIALTSNHSMVAVGSGGSIWKYDGGAWMRVSSGVDSDLLAVSFLDDKLGVVVGVSGTILFSEDGGATWSYRDAPTEVSELDITSVVFYSDVRIYATTTGGQVLISSKDSVTDVGFLWTSVTFERHYPPGSNEYASWPKSLEVEITSLEVTQTTRFHLTGPDGYIAMSVNGGSIVSQQINPLENNSTLNDIAMITKFVGVVVGDDGSILWTGNAGADEQVGFEVMDFNDFGEFVDYSKETLFGGFLATIKIVMFGIVLGFLLGIILAMGKTSPISLRNTIERFDSNKVRYSGVPLLVIGVYMFYLAIPEVEAIGLDGIEHIFVPVGAPWAFAKILLGIGLTFVGLMFLSHNGKFAKLEYRSLSLNPWGVRPLNSIATVYTDFFRNTPLIVQFLFIHFGLQAGMYFQDLGTGLCSDIYILLGGVEGVGGSTDIWELRSGKYAEDAPGFLVSIHRFMFSDRAYLSAVCALGLNSGAYQCETIRGAIQAIPSAQMEAGRSIGLTYLQTMRRVILPQAIRICIPPMGNEMVNLVLNSSLAMVIGYAELTRQGKLITALTFQMAYTWGMVLISYFVITWTLALILRRLEEKTRIPGLGMTGGE